MSPQRPRSLGQLGTDYSHHLARRSRDLVTFGVAACATIGRRVRQVCAAEAYELGLLVFEAKALHARTTATFSPIERAPANAQLAPAARVA